MKKSSTPRGFTLVEIMVAVSLFIVVAFIVTSAFTSFAEANRRAQATRISVDNLNFAMESIVLKMREGNDYRCGDDYECPNSPSETVTFLADNGKTVKYWLEAADNTGNETIFKCEYDPDSGSCGQSANPIVAPEVKISQLNFYIKNDQRPRARIVIKGKIDTRVGSKDFTLQTTVSQRR